MPETLIGENTFSQRMKEMSGKVELFRSLKLRSDIKHIFHDTDVLSHLVKDDFLEAIKEGDVGHITNLFKRVYSEEGDFHRRMLHLFMQLSIIMDVHRELVHMLIQNDAVKLQEAGFPKDLLDQFREHEAKGTHEWVYGMEEAMKSILACVEKIDKEVK